jgi:hypothetical protein
MDVHLRGVQHRLEVRVVEGDRLAVVLYRLFELALERRDVTEEVIGLRRLTVDLQRSPRRNFRAARISALYEVPPAIQMCRELVHGVRALLVFFAGRVKEESPRPPLPTASARCRRAR